MGNQLQVVETPRELDRGRARLLLVDDNVDDLLYYTSILQHLAYDVRPCASFTEAANSFARDDFDLVIVSQGGTSFEGRAVLTRAIEADRTTPVLVLTRNPSMDCYVEAMQLGAFDYREKPLSPSEVGQLVAYHLRISMPTRGMACDRARDAAPAEQFVH